MQGQTNEMAASIAEFRKAEVSVILAKFILTSSYEDIMNEIHKISTHDTIKPDDLKKVLKIICHATDDEIERVLSLVLTNEVVFKHVFFDELDDALREKRAEHPGVKKFK